LEARGAPDRTGLGGGLLARAGRASGLFVLRAVLRELDLAMRFRRNCAGRAMIAVY